MSRPHSAYYIVFLTHNTTADHENPMPSPTESVMQMFLMSLTNFGAVYEAFSFTEHEVVAKVNTFKIYMVTLTNVNSLV